VNLRESVVLDQPVSLGACADQGDAKIDLYKNQQVDLRVQTKCPGVLVLSDNWFPGWNATLDGKSVPILEADGALRAIAVPRGVHRIEMRYSPASIGWGGAVSLMTFLVIAAMAVIRKRGQPK